MAFPSWLAPALVLSLALAGCSGSSNGSAANTTEEDLSATHGTVVGLVTDDEAQPIEGVAVSIKAVKVSPIAIKILTNEAGRFSLDKVPAGKQTVIAEREGYNEASTTITVIPGAETTVRLILGAKPVNEYKVVPLALIKGQYTCAAEVWAQTGSCDYEVYNQTHNQVLPFTNNHTFEVPANWGGILFEIRWELGQGYMEGVRFQLESQEDLGAMFAKASGTTPPMRIELNAGEVSPDATVGYPMPQRGVKTWIHILPLGYYEGATCQAQCGKGFGVALQMTYEVATTEFFGGPVDPNYSAYSNG